MRWWTPVWRWPWSSSIINSTRRRVDALEGRVLGLAGYAVFETFSVLTRLPPPARRSPTTVVELMKANFSDTYRALKVEVEFLADR